MKVIVKYYGSLDGVRAIADDVKVSELLAQYAVVDIDTAYLDELRNVPEVIYIEEPRRVYPTGEITRIPATEKNSASDTQNEPGIMQGNIQENRLSGKGVLVGIVDSGIVLKNILVIIKLVDTVKILCVIKMPSIMKMLCLMKTSHIKLQGI